MREAIKFIKENLKGHLIGAEIGAAQGTHALEIVKNLDCKLYLIDIWEDYFESFGLFEKPHLSKANFTKEMVLKKLKGYDIEVIKEESIKASLGFPDEFFDFVYIDANHTYECVLMDIQAWRLKVKRGGVLAGHDYCDECEGVKKAIDTIFPYVNSINNTRYPDWYVLNS